MSEIKRVALNTLEPQKVSEKVFKKPFKTVRISVILPESNEDYCPEYNYKDQLASAKKKGKQCKSNNTNGLENGADPLGDNDDDVRRIALQMEAKYGSGVMAVTKKKRKGKKDDYADIGMGYDESDSFIDNTDGYDEIIPQNVTTLHGGFYVNSGALVFKTDDEASSHASTSSSSSSSNSSSSDTEGDEKTKSKGRKRILETSDDSDSDTANAQKEKKLKIQSTSANSMQQAIKKKLFSKNKIQVKKFKTLEQQKKTVKDLLRAKREDLNMSVPDELKTVEDNIEKDSSKENKKPMNITSVTDAIESVVKQVVEENTYDKKQINQSVEVATNVINILNNVDSLELVPTDANEVKADLRKPGKEEEPKLPENLPGDIALIISKLTDAAINYKGEGKKAFFTKEVNVFLLSLEKKSKSLSKSSRIKIYEHLAKYVNCTKDTLIRRAKQLELEEGETRLTNLKIKLKDSIDAIMPTLKASYEQESEKILQKKFSKENVNNEEIKSLKLPRRKFQWSEEAKKLVKDILSVKKRCLVIEGKHKDNLEEQIEHFLRTVVLPLWPEGWMYMNNLKKVYNSMQENSRSSTSISKDLTVTINPPQKHSNISIIPIANGKSNSENIEITNSITVTKVNCDVNDDLKSKHSEKNHSLTMINLSKGHESNSSHISSEKSKHTKSFEKPLDISAHTKKNDMFKPYINNLSKSLSSDVENPSSVQKNTKNNEMFKPYADEAKVSNINDRSLIHTEITHQILEKDKQHSPVHLENNQIHSLLYLEKVRLTTPHSCSDKEKQSSQLHLENITLNSNLEKDKHTIHKHNSHNSSDGKSKEKKLHPTPKLPAQTEDIPNTEKPPSLSKKATDLSKFQMFKPYSETPKSHEDKSKYRLIDDISKRPHDIALLSKAPPSRYEVPSKPISSAAEESGVIVKNVQQVIEKHQKDDKMEVIPVAPKPAHCQGVNFTDKRKVLEPYKRTSTDLNSIEFFPVAVNKSSIYASTPLVSKSEGDGQQDIQMVMENLKALQKLSCSPVKNIDTSSSSPVSVIAYNKNVSSQKTSSCSRNEANSRSEFSGGFQDEFQKQFINSLQQLAAASTSGSKAGYNNGS